MTHRFHCAVCEKTTIHEEVTTYRPFPPEGERDDWVCVGCRSLTPKSEDMQPPAQPWRLAQRLMQIIGGSHD